MKRCYICQREYEDALEDCPYCSTMQNSVRMTQSGVGANIDSAPEVSSVNATGSVSGVTSNTIQASSEVNTTSTVNSGVNTVGSTSVSNTTTNVAGMNSVNQMGQMNQPNAMNQMGQMNQSTTMNQMGQMNQSTTMNQMGQMNQGYQGQNMYRQTPKVFCKICGSEIRPGADFCSNCGSDIYDTNKKHCPNCGNILDPKQKFCDRCGQKREKIVLPKGVKSAQSKVTKTKVILGIIAVILVVGLVVAGTKFVPKLFTKYDAYMAEGDYVKAYEKAKTDDEKDLVIKENLAAFVSNLCKESLKDSTSFVLREVYVEEDYKNIVIKDQGNNSYGAAVSGYDWYVWDDEDEEFKFYGSCNDFDQEEINSYDSEDEMIEKLADNMVKKHIKETINVKNLKMDSDTVDRINDLNKDDKLDDVELLDESKDILNKESDDDDKA